MSLQHGNEMYGNVRALRRKINLYTDKNKSLD